MARHNLALVVPAPSGSAEVNRLAAKYKAIGEELKTLEARKKAVAEKLLAATEDEGQADAEGKVRLSTDDYNLVVIDGQSADAISATLLLELGVRPSVIKKATVAGTKYRYVGIYPKGAAKPSRKAKSKE